MMLNTKTPSDEDSISGSLQRLFPGLTGPEPNKTAFAKKCKSHKDCKVISNDEDRGMKSNRDCLVTCTYSNKAWL